MRRSGRALWKADTVRLKVEGTLQQCLTLCLFRLDVLAVAFCGNTRQAQYTIYNVLVGHVELLMVSLMRVPRVGQSIKRNDDDHRQKGATVRKRSAFNTSIVDGLPSR